MNLTQLQSKKQQQTSNIYCPLHLHSNTPVSSFCRVALILEFKKPTLQLIFRVKKLIEPSSRDYMPKDPLMGGVNVWCSIGKPSNTIYLYCVVVPTSSARFGSTM